MNNLTKKEIIALKWMNDNFGFNHLKAYTCEKHPNSIFYKKGEKIVMEQVFKNKRFWFNYFEIWSFFETFFGMEYNEIRRLLNVFLEEQSNLREYTYDCCLFGLEEQSNLRELK